mgnify:CR=1 FL=1
MTSVRPAFWQPQPRLALAHRRFLTTRVEAALAEPSRRTVLVWPSILGAPVQTEAHPDGLPESELMVLGVRMIRAVRAVDPSVAWTEDLIAFPDTAQSGGSGWIPHDTWRPVARTLSLRSAVTLLALTGQPEDERYLLSSAVSLFKLCLFHECHDALEILWRRSEGELREGLQGLILLACGFHHQQYQNRPGMAGVWKDGIPRLRRLPGTLDTPWGRVGYAGSLAMATQRLDWLRTASADQDWARFWEMPSPEWEFT